MRFCEGGGAFLLCSVREKDDDGRSAISERDLHCLNECGFAFCFSLALELRKAVHRDNNIDVLETLGSAVISQEQSQSSVDKGKQ